MAELPSTSSTPPASPLRYKKKSRGSPSKCSLFSPLHTKQQDETCRFHTLSKMIVRDIFDKYLPITNPKDIEKYEDFMPLVTPITPEILATYSEENCSRNGYLKIMLFYYFFILTKQANLKTIEGDALQRLLEMPPIPQIDVGIFATLKEQIRDERWFGYKLELGDPSFFPQIKTDLLVPLFREKLYVELGLRPYEDEEYEETGAEEPSTKENKDDHIVLIVGLSQDGRLNIKNSWDDPESYVDFEEIIELEGYKFALDALYFIFKHDLGEYEFESYDADKLFDFVKKNTKGGKRTRKRKRSKTNTRRYKNKRLL